MASYSQIDLSIDIFDKSHTNISKYVVYYKILKHINDYFKYIKITSASIKTEQNHHRGFTDLT